MELPEPGCRSGADCEVGDFLYMVRKSDTAEMELWAGTLFPLSLPEIFNGLYYYLYTNSNIPRAERLGAEMVRILFCKIYDELTNRDAPIFQSLAYEDEDTIAQKIASLFEDVKREFPEVFGKDERLHLDGKSIAYVVRQLSNHELTTQSRDVISEAFQAFLGPGLRGEKGQFFTPRNVVRMCVEFLEPGLDDRIIDPACGSGGFLVESMMFVGRTPFAPLTTGVNDEASVRDFSDNIFGIDKEIDLAKICRAYMTIIGGKHTSVFCADSLNPQTWPREMKEKIEDGSFTLVFTNPPFGARISLEDKRVLSNYELGHEWKKYADGQWKVTKKVLQKQAPQVLFIERCLQLLKPGGKVAIVLPDGVFGNPTDRYIMQYIFDNTKVLAVVSLSPETFLPGTHTKTSVLFLEKPGDNLLPEDYEIFMAIAYRVGHDKNGKIVYKMDTNGNYIIDKMGKKIVDDDLPEITERYKAFKRGALAHYNHLGFAINRSQVKDFILIPGYYNPETKQKLIDMERSGRYRCITIGKLVAEGVLSIKRGHEVGSQYYGMGDVPFVRTSDIVNWEIKIDPVKCIPEEIYEKFRKRQDISENDILLITDGTFLIGRTAIVLPLDRRIVIQSHIRRIRCLKPNILHPYLLLYLLNTDIVQRQIQEKTFVQATISTLGNRLYEIVLPIPVDKSTVEEIINEVAELVKLKIEARAKVANLLQRGI
ncbi:MAG: N-6 DNA methylase [Anaerolineae bacterium]